MLRGHTVHRVLDILERARACCDVEQGEVCYTRLVLLVECQLCSVGREEDTARDTELVTAHGLSADDVLILVCCYGNLLLAIEEIEVVLACICI